VGPGQSRAAGGVEHDVDGFDRVLEALAASI
jgi:hypothetical protein